jgi:PadR family transcriptional regulator, regulatory protein AphA
MQAKRPNPTDLSYGALAAIGESGATTTELVEMLSRGHMYHPWPASQVYAEPKRLLALGWVTSEKVPARTRNRTVYRITAEGREALREHLRAPAGWPRIQHAAARRLFAGEMITDEEILTSLLKLRADIDEMRAVVETNVARIPQLPERRQRYARLLQDLGRRLVDAHADWLDAVEDELGPGATKHPPSALL